LFTVGTRVVDIHLVNSGLIDLDLSVGKNDQFRARLQDISGHLGLFAYASKIDLSFLGLGRFVNDFVVLSPGEAGLGGFELRRCLVHLPRYVLEIARRSCDSRGTQDCPTQHCSTEFQKRLALFSNHGLNRPYSRCAHTLYATILPLLSGTVSYFEMLTLPEMGSMMVNKLALIAESLPPCTALLST